MDKQNDNFKSEDEQNDGRGIDNPGLNQDGSHDVKDDQDFDETDDFHKYDDVDHSNIEPSDPIATSNEHINENSDNVRPTFNRTYDKNTPDDDAIDTAGRFDGTVGI